MLSNDQIVNLHRILSSSTGSNRWRVDDLCVAIGIDPRNKYGRKEVKRQINKFKRLPEFNYLAYNKGYFIVEYEDEFHEIGTIFKNRSNGLAEIANKFFDGKTHAKKHTDNIQPTLFDDIEESM